MRKIKPAVIMLLILVMMVQCKKAGDKSGIMLEKKEVSELEIYESADEMPMEMEKDTALPEDRFNTEEYDKINENKFHNVIDHPLSTFSIDVDTAAYSNMRRFIEWGELPPPDAVRIEE